MFVYTPLQLKALDLLASAAHHIMLFGGSRSGKSFVLCCSLIARALRAPGSRHAVIRRYCANARASIGLDTMPKILRTRFRNKVPCIFSKGENFFRFKNNSEIWLIGLDDGERADKILGKEFATIYFNECSELEYGAVQIALTRLAQNIPPLVNRAYYDCNPPGRNHWSYQLFMKKCDPVSREQLADPADYCAMQMNPEANRSNLPPGYIEKTLANLPEKQRLRFLKGEWLDDLEGALWHWESIERSRVKEVPELERIVIGVDPAVTSGQESDLTGIIAAGSSFDGDIYVLADRSIHSTPLVWVRQVIELYHELDAEKVVVEINNGGELITSLFAREDDSVKVKAVRAYQDKFRRAEPAAAFYEKSIVHHAGVFPELEEQMCAFKAGKRSHSPDRVDALVWALSELTGSYSGERFIIAGS